MKKYRVELVARHPVRIAAASLALLSLFVTAVTAQQPMPRRPPVGTRDGDTVSRRLEAERDMRAREWNLRSLEKMARAVEEDQMVMRQRQMLIAQQIKKDYYLLQVHSYDMARAVAANAALDYKQVAEKTSEINKGAKRLREYLALPRLDEKEEKTQAPPLASDGQGLKRMLSQLDSRVLSFVHNPFFQNPGVVDVEQSARASRDLKNIIELSNCIKKSAERMHKTAGQPKH